MKHHWKSLKSLGNPRRSCTHHRKVIDNASKTKSWQIIENHRTFIEKTENHGTIIDESLIIMRKSWKTLGIIEILSKIIEQPLRNHRKSLKIIENRWTSLKIIGKSWKISMLLHFLTLSLFTCLVWFRVRSPQMGQIYVYSSSCFLCFRDVFLGDKTGC